MVLSYLIDFLYKKFNFVLPIFNSFFNIIENVFGLPFISKFRKNNNDDNNDSDDSNDLFLAPSNYQNIKSTSNNLRSCAVSEFDYNFDSPNPFSWDFQNLVFNNNNNNGNNINNNNSNNNNNIASNNITNTYNDLTINNRNKNIDNNIDNNNSINDNHSYNNIINNNNTDNIGHTKDFFIHKIDNKNNTIDTTNLFNENKSLHEQQNILNTFSSINITSTALKSNHKINKKSALSQNNLFKNNHNSQPLESLNNQTSLNYYYDEYEDDYYDDDDYDDDDSYYGTDNEIDIENSNNNFIKNKNLISNDENTLPLDDELMISYIKSSMLNDDLIIDENDSFTSLNIPEVEDSTKATQKYLNIQQNHLKRDFDLYNQNENKVKIENKINIDDTTTSLRKHRKLSTSNSSNSELSKSIKNNKSHSLSSTSSCISTASTSSLISTFNKSKKIYTCEICNTNFKVKGYLTRHKKKHFASKPYQCPFFDPNCIYDSNDKSNSPKCHPTGGFTRRDTFKTHLKALHFVYPTGTKSGDRSNRKGRCAACFKEFKTNKEWLETHVETNQCEGMIIEYK